MKDCSESVNPPVRILLIRHGATKGNKEHRYVGSTDEPLLPESAEELRKVRVCESETGGTVHLYTSPLLRARETAEILFPDLTAEVIPDFRECDFGEFEYRNYHELDGNANYQKFIDSGGMCGFPGGETLQEFQDRTVKVFLALPEIGQNSSEPIRDRAQTVAIVAHGGTIMALLDAFSEPHAEYFSWQAGNGEGYSCLWDSKHRSMTGIRKISKEYAERH